MKPNNLQSNVRAKSERKTGDAPDIGRVARIPGAGNASGKVRRRRRSDPSQRTFGDKRRIRKNQARRFAIKLWISLILLACCGAIATGLILWLRSQDDRKNISAQRNNPAILMPTLDITDFPPPSEGDALRIFLGALAARNEATLRQYVRDTDEADVDQMLAFFADSRNRDGKFSSHQWVGSSDTDSLQIQTLGIVFDGAERPTHRLAQLLPDAAGNWQLDFPAYARWCDPPIRLMDTDGGYPGGRIRCFIAPDAYYNGPFADDRKWASIAIASHETTTTGIGYVRLGSPQHRAIMAIFDGQPRRTRAILEIQRREGAQTRQFEITRVLAAGWVLGDIPIDSHYE